MRSRYSFTSLTLIVFSTKMQNFFRLMPPEKKNPHDLQTFDFLDRLFFRENVEILQKGYLWQFFWTMLLKWYYNLKLSIHHVSEASLVEKQEKSRLYRKWKNDGDTAVLEKKIFSFFRKASLPEWKGAKRPLWPNLFVSKQIGSYRVQNCTHARCNGRFSLR